jgi:hypothetical protein
MSKTGVAGEALGRWLEQRGLTENPFAAWNAERDPDLPGYFVDTGHFDDLLDRVDPCVVFARRGCGKTAQRQMLAAQCRPFRPDSTWLAIPYTFTGFERALASAGNDVAQLRASHHVAALLRQGLAALENEARRDPLVHSALTAPLVAPSWQAYLGRYAPHIAGEPDPAAAGRLEGLGTLELLEGFVRLLQAAGLERGLVLVDGVDEILAAAADTGYLAALLAPLLGTLSLIECPGLACKFFLPQEAEAVLRRCGWYRPDRLHLYHIAWQEGDLEALLGQRLTYFSQEGDRAYTRLGQLCVDELAGSIDKELAALAAGQPRAALILADMLLQAHCAQPRPAARIAPESWTAVLAAWPARRAEMQMAGPPAAETGQPGSAAPTDWPLLAVDKASGCVYLGEQEVGGIRTQDMRVLVCLYEYRDQVCMRDELIEKAWPEAQGGVTDQAVAASIARLRRNLGQAGPYAGYIKTVTGRGYRLHPRGFGSKPPV